MQDAPFQLEVVPVAMHPMGQLMGQLMGRTGRDYWRKIAPAFNRPAAAAALAESSFRPLSARIRAFDTSPGVASPCPAARSCMHRDSTRLAQELTSVSAQQNPESQ